MKKNCSYKNNERMSTESFTTNKKERMQEGVSLAQGEKKHLAVKFQYELATRKYQTLLKKELDKKEIQEVILP